MSGAAEFDKLAADFERSAVQAGIALRVVVQEGMAEIKDQWRSNATETSGSHGRYYPSSITYETHVTAGGITGEVGADSSKKQGSMGRGFEFGSVNQPPHLDGLRAVQSVGLSLDRRFDAVLGHLLP